MTILLTLPVLLFAAQEQVTLRVTPQVTVVRGAVNGVFLAQNGKILAIYGDPRPGAPARAEMVLFTHHRRDAAWAGRALVRRGAAAVTPAAEMALFTDVRQYWEKRPAGRYRDLSMRSRRVLAEPLAPVRGVKGGERIDWQGQAIEVLDTPGYTPGAVAYLFENGGKRIACSGDLIYGDGRLLDLYSLQDAIPEAKEDAYHGYGARAAALIASLDRLAEWKPDVLIPARGPVIHDPRQAIDRLKQRLRDVFASHFAIDALRWYRGDDNLRVQARRVLGAREPAWMPRAETMPLPEWIIAIANSRLLISRTGAAYLIDCGSRRILEKVQALEKEGRFRAVEGLYVTHYHSDHTAAVAEAAAALRCPVYACGEMKDILERPQSYDMPVMTANAIRPVTATGDGQKVRWHEFEFTYTHHPGQTWYHGGLLVKKDGGETIFFSGDSFTPTGMDDYCLLNRNFVAPQKGYTECLEALEQMDAWVVNQHVEPMFRYRPALLGLMKKNFAERARLFAALFPWDDPNYGLDEQWLRLYPYSAEVKAGQPFDLEAIVLNHSPARRRFRVTLSAPPGWRVDGALTLEAGARQEKSGRLRVRPAAGATGVHVVTADVASKEMDLREWAEALIVVKR